MLPDRKSVSDEWINQAMNSLSDSLRTRHFALLTSGSTGLPKIVVGSREKAENLARVLHEKQRSEPVKRTVLGLPLSYCYAFVNQYVWSRVMGRELAVTRGFKDADQFKNALDNPIETMLCLVGAQMPLFIQNYGDNVFPGVIRLHFAGGHFPQPSIGIIRRLFPNAEIFNNYGCAEAMPRLTLRKLEESQEGANIGRPLPGITLKTDGDGRILFLSPYRAVGFYDSEGWHLVGNEEWVPSGDLGEEISGGYWKITGRSNEVFKRYGEKISLPGVLESVYGVWPHPAGVFREKDRAGEEGYVLVLSPAPDPEQIQRILQTFRKKHPRTQWPLRVESTAELPMLSNGKIDALGLKNLSGKMVHWDQRI